MKKFLLSISAVALLSGAAVGQSLHEGYITWPDTHGLGDYIKQWNGGSGTIKVDGKAWEDQEFFTSRVKPRTRFTNTATQVYPNRLAYNKETKEGTDKRMIYWVCVSDEKTNAAKSNALPNGLFDQEVFNMWSYVDTYGNWGAPFGWTPGVFADAAHKNGVGVSGVASVPFNPISTEWVTTFDALGSCDKPMILKFLKYFGQNGLAYNSEWTGGGTQINKLIDIHNYLQENTDDPTWEVIWYGGTTDSGGRAFDTGVGSTGDNTKLFNSASMFLNYNWNSTYYITQSIAHAKSVGRDPFRIYAAMNMQGGEPKAGSNYTMLKDYQYGIGIWAGHNNNILWKSRAQEGSDPVTKLTTYNKINEQFFGNGKRNPAIKQTIIDNRTHAPHENFAGMSAMMNARSTMNHVISSEPFYTYFNLGNGKFFNWKGERMNDNQWYNIGVQDFTPTWRYWFAPTWLQTDVTEGSTHLAADFTWEDAYMGGSCLKVEGSTNTEYLHLFKTDMKVAYGQVITVRYKLLEGEADVRLVCTSVDEPKNEKADWTRMVLCTVADALDIQDNSYLKGSDGWVTKTFTIGPTWTSKTSLPGTKIGAIGLEFKNAKNMKLLLGEISILPAKAVATPVQPQVKLAKLFKNGYKGVDGKLIWTMDNDAALKAGTPKYNSDVKTAMFRTWSQQEGGEPVQIGATTSWAALMYQCPIDKKGSGKIRFGVSAVSMDNRSESEIAWSNYLDLPNYEKVVDIAVDKAVIKPNEKFTMSFVDDMMGEATWVLKDASQTNESLAEVWRGTGKSVTCPGLSSVGAYHLVLTYNDSRATVEKEFPRYITITSPATGALPEIYSIAMDGEDVSEHPSGVEIKTVNSTTNFSYTGRYADGAASRGVSLDEGWFGVGNDQLKIQANKSFTVACWIRYDELPEGCSNFLTIENRKNGGWPYNNWGFFWSRINDQGGFTANRVDGAWGMRSTGEGTEGNRIYYVFREAKIDLGVWTHVAVTFDYNSSGLFRQHFYVNGRKMKVERWINCNKGELQTAVGGEDGDWTQLQLAKNYSSTVGYGEDTYDPAYTSKAQWPMTDAYKIAFGGSAPNVSAVKGSIDDFQVWGKVMTQEDINASMYGLDKNNLPADVLGYWDFETEPGSDHGYVGYTGSKATNKAPKAYWWKLTASEDYGYAKPDYLSGCPIIPGSAYPIVTKPTWTTRATVEESSGNGEEGEAAIKFSRTGDYAVDLTLSNGHGSSSMSFPVITVMPKTSGIEGVVADGGEVATYTINDMLFLDFAEGGEYGVSVYDTAGMLAAQKALSVVDGQTASISLANAGVYIVKIVKDGVELRTVKVIRK